jgi:hypothetical protein
MTLALEARNKLYDINIELVYVTEKKAALSGKHLRRFCGGESCVINSDHAKLSHPFTGALTSFGRLTSSVLGASPFTGKLVLQ